MLALGGDPDAIPTEWPSDPSTTSAAIDPDFEVMPECWPAIQVFLRCQNAWLFSPTGQRMCMIRSELATVAEVLDLDRRQIMEDIYLMEATILEVWTRQELAEEAKRKAQARVAGNRRYQ